MKHKRRFSLPFPSLAWSVTHRRVLAPVTLVHFTRAHVRGVGVRYGAAAIKCRGDEAVTNFDMSNYRQELAALDQIGGGSAVRIHK
jgi:hypothetical protein